MKKWRLCPPYPWKLPPLHFLILRHNYLCILLLDTLDEAKAVTKDMVMTNMGEEAAQDLPDGNINCLPINNCN